MNNRNRLTTWILVGLVLGIVVGYVANANLQNPAGFADTLSLVTTLFLRLIKMIIAPLVFSTLVVGIAKMGDAKEVGRIGVKALGWFVIASLLSLTLGLILVNLFRPGDAMALAGHLPDAGAVVRHRRHRPDAEGLHHPPGADLDRRRHGQERDPADRDLRDLLRHRRRRRRRARQPADRRDRRRRPRHAEGDRLRDELRALRRVRGGGRRGRHQRRRRAVHLRQVHGRVLPRHRAAVGRADRDRRAVRRPAHPEAARPAARADHPGLHLRLVGSRLSEDPGRPGALRREEPPGRLRAADRLLVQPGRLDDVLHLRHRCSSPRPTASRCRCRPS